MRPIIILLVCAIFSPAIHPGDVLPNILSQQAGRITMGKATSNPRVDRSARAGFDASLSVARALGHANVGLKNT